MGKAVSVVTICKSWVCLDPVTKVKLILFMIAKLFDYSAVILVNQIHPYLSQAKDICAFMFMKKPFSVS